MKKADKLIFVKDLTEELKSASSIVLVDFTGLTVKNQQGLKKRLKEIGAKMFVTKNTLFKLAGREAKIPDEALQDTVLTGPTAYIISEQDPIAPLQIIYKFATENEILGFKVGVIEGNFQDKESLITLAKLPSKQVLFAQAVGTIASPMYGLVGTLQANLQKLVYVLDQKSKTG